uniref:Small ribosomal subunit protein eS10 n=1 Tax=Panthera tigris altaica TaxID=74533 RepID=A0A8C9KQ13_PANTA
MLMLKKNRIAIYELLFKDGMMVAKKDIHMPKDHVMKATQSLSSQSYIKEEFFAWRHFYRYLTSQGIQYLYDCLHLPPDIVSASLYQQARAQWSGGKLTVGEADRDTCRRSTVTPDANKKAEARIGSATEFQFRGGFWLWMGIQPPMRWVGGEDGH